MQLLLSTKQTNKDNAPQLQKYANQSFTRIILYRMMMFLKLSTLMTVARKKYNYYVTKKWSDLALTH